MKEWTTANARNRSKSTYPTFTQYQPLGYFWFLELWQHRVQRQVIQIVRTYRLQVTSRKFIDFFSWSFIQPSVPCHYVFPCNCTRDLCFSLQLLSLCLCSIFDSDEMQWFWLNRKIDRKKVIKVITNIC